MCVKHFYGKVMSDTELTVNMEFWMWLRYSYAVGCGKLKA